MDLYSRQGALEEFDLALGEWNEIADSIALDAARGRLSVLLNSFSEPYLSYPLPRLPLDLSQL